MLLSFWNLGKEVDDFLTNSLVLYIEREISVEFGTKSSIGDFWELKERWGPILIDDWVEMLKTKTVIFCLYFVNTNRC